MRKSRKILIAAVSTAAAAGIAVPMAATAASAAVTHPASLTAYHRPMPKVAIAGVEITSSGYERYAQVFAIQEHGYKGFVHYTNFNVPEAGSHVWAPSGQAGTLAFTVKGTTSTYDYSLGSGVTLRAASPTDVRFAGTGTYPGFTWAIQGHVKGDHVSYTLIYDPANPSVAKYRVTAQGTIASDGSASGTAVQTLKGVKSADLTWTLPAGTFQQVDHFIAPVSSVQVKGHQNAIVTFTIPSHAVSAGTVVTWTMHNGGKPSKDTWSESDNSAAPFSETVEAGHIYISR